MKLKLYAPAHGGSLALQLERADGAAWLALKEGDEVVYADRANVAPGCDLARVTGYVSQKIVRADFDPPELVIVLRVQPEARLGVDLARPGTESTQVWRIAAEPMERGEPVTSTKPRCKHTWKNGDRCILDRDHKGRHGR